MIRRIIALAGVAVGLTWVSAGLSQVGSATSRPPLAGVPSAKVAFRPKLSKQQKLEIVRAKTKLPNATLSDEVAVDIRNPYRHNQAKLGLYDAEAYTTEHEYATLKEQGSVHLILKVVRPGKYHLVSFYVNATGTRAYKIMAFNRTFSKKYLDETQNLAAGPAVVSAVFKPDQTGEYVITLSPGARFFFTRAESTLVP